MFDECFMLCLALELCDPESIVREKSIEHHIIQLVQIAGRVSAREGLGQSSGQCGDKVKAWPLLDSGCPHHQVGRD